MMCLILTMYVAIAVNNCSRRDFRQTSRASVYEFVPFLWRSLMWMQRGQTLIRLVYCLFPVSGLNQSFISQKSSNVQGIPHWVHKQDFSSPFATFYPLIFQKSSSVPSPSSSQSTASNACSPSACNLSRPVRLSRNPDSLNAFNNMANPSVSYALRTCNHQKKFIIRSAIPLIVSTARRTVSLHPVQRSYAAPTIGILRNCARNPRNWCGTRPSTLPSPSRWGCWGPCPGGGAGARRLQKVAIKTPKYSLLRPSGTHPRGC